MHSKIFKGLGIYDIDYHEKYYQYIKEKRYKKHLEALEVEMFTRLIDLKRQLDIEKKLKEQFPEPKYIIIYPE